MNYVGSEHRDVSLILMNLTHLILLKEFDSGGGNFKSDFNSARAFEMFSA